MCAGREKKFGNRLFRELLLSACTVPIVEQQGQLETVLTDWIGTRPQTDDICVLGFTVG